MIRYRTSATLLLFGLMVLAALLMLPREARAGVAPAAIAALSSLGLYAAGKAAWEKHVEAKNGGKP